MAELFATWAVNLVSGLGFLWRKALRTADVQVSEMA